MNQWTQPGMTRRQFLYLSSMAAAGFVAGCATNPVTGESQLMLVSEQQEIDLDKQHSPHQFSADYGASQDSKLNAYVDGVGRRLAALSHRPQMPYSFRVVNANYVNAYAFPGGSIAATRGILLKLEDEAELAALMGHELGHVNARHTAEVMSKGMIANVLVGGLSAYVGATTGLGDVAAQIGMLGSGALLASYSRDNERQADDLGMRYLVKGNYGPQGMVGLMDMLKSLSKGGHSSVQMLFSTHPMSSERYDTAVNTANTTHRAAKGKPLYRERYKDNIAGVRRIRGAIETMQKGEAEMGREKYADAEKSFASALKQAPRDYAGLMLMAKCQLAQKKNGEAERYLARAQRTYPQEAQSYFINGYVKLKAKKYDTALAQLGTYEKKLTGNPTVTFFKGVAYEGKQVRKTAAEHYYQYLQAVNQGKNAQYAYNRLVEWGYVKKQQ